MKALIPVVMAAATLLSACSSQPTPTSEPIPEPITQAPVQSTMLNFVGQLELSQDVWYFQSCSSDANPAMSFELSLTEKDEALLKDFAQGPAFAELKAQMVVQDGKAYLRPNYWHLISNEVQVCREGGFHGVAFGNEPSWHIDLEGSELEFQGMNGARTLRVVEQNTKDDITTWILNEANKLTVAPGPCYDTMAGSYFADSAELELDLNLHKGCAHVPFDAYGKNWQGIYQSFPGADVDWHQLKLNDDWSMSWELQSSTTNEAYRAQGFWYVVSIDQIDLVLQNSDGSIDQRVRMNWDGQQLSPVEDSSLGLVVLPWQQSLIRVNQPSARPGLAIANDTSLPLLSAQTLVANTSRDAQVEQALQRYFKLHRTQPSGERYLWWKFDLNGDGRQEILTMLNWCHSGSCELLIFEPVDGATHRFLAKILKMPMRFELAQSSSRGWYDIIAAQKLLQFDGLSYPVSAQVPSSSNALPSSGVLFVLPDSGFTKAARLR